MHLNAQLNCLYHSPDKQTRPQKKEQDCHLNKSICPVSRNDEVVSVKPEKPRLTRHLAPSFGPGDRLFGRQIRFRIP